MGLWEARVALRPARGRACGHVVGELTAAAVGTGARAVVEAKPPRWHDWAVRF